MKLVRVNRRLPSALDYLRRARVKRIWAAYWIVTVAAAVALNALGTEITLIEWFRRVARVFPSVAHVAAQSFNVPLVEAFCGISLSVGMSLFVLSLFWVPRGSEIFYLNGRSRFLMICMSIIAVVATFGILIWGGSIDEGTRNYSASLKRLGADSLFGMVLILNAFYGFGQLFFLMAARAAMTTDVGGH